MMRPIAETPQVTASVEEQIHADCVNPIHAKGTSRRVYDGLYKVADLQTWTFISSSLEYVR